MSNASLINQMAERLWNAQSNKEPCSPIQALFDDNVNVEMAYQIQQVNLDRAINEQNARVIGKKIGLTSKAVQKQLGVDQPDYGSLFASMVVAEGQTISLAGLLQPKVEAEVALVLKHDLLHADSTLVELINAIDYVLPAIEIVDSRVKNWKISIEDTIADNASSALVALGQKPIALKDIALEKIGMAMFSQGELVSSGNGAACLGNPLLAALWLTNTMAQKGTPLKAGDLILTGALGPMVTVNKPSTFSAFIQDVGEVNVTFTE